VRHRRSGRKLGRDPSHRKALYANLTGALIEHGRIKTTAAKAKEVKPIAEQMITLGRRGGVHARRQALAYLRSQDVVHKLFSDVGPRFADRPGGYSRIVRIGPRPGDSAEMVYLELVDFLPEAEAPRPRRARREETVEALGVACHADHKRPRQLGRRGPSYPVAPSVALTPAITIPASVT
jgi:large subunit ribosomal protein L17